MIPGLTSLDLVAVSIFLAGWLIYHALIESPQLSKYNLNSRMNAYRHAWIEEMLRRENRIVDVQVMSSLHQGSAFFASTSLIAVGGALSLIRGGADLSSIMAMLPFGASSSTTVWELKIVGLAFIFVYAFFKFAWAYRLFNYAAILLGSVPVAGAVDSEGRRRAHRCAAMTVVAGQHFNRGQRAFFFALAYLGWFLGSAVFIVTTIAAMIVMARRQFSSDALKSILIDTANDIATEKSDQNSTQNLKSGP